MASSDVSAVVNHFSTAAEGFTTTLASTASSGATTLALTSTSGLTNGKIFVGIIEPGTVGKEQTFTGVVDTGGNQITGVKWTRGSNTGHNAGVTIVDYVSGTGHNMMTKGLLVEHDQDGTHSAITATSITATTGTFTNLTIAGTASAEGWSPLGATPNTVTANGNRSYDLVFNGTDLTDTLSPGMRVKATRTVTAPTQCADLEASSSHYFSKASPSGMTFTDDFTCAAWIKLESYGAVNGIIARRNGDVEGWSMEINTDGTLRIASLRIAANNRTITTYQSIPLNKWVHVAASMDNSGGSYATYIDGVSVPNSTTTNGTITALVQPATDLVVGAYKSAGTSPFDGKIAQAAVFSAVLSAATIKAMATQTLTGSETNLVSAFSLSNTLNDLNTGNANNLTANGGALATATDTPFAGGSVGTTEYGIVTAATFSTNTTLTVQVPEGYALPTTGGISAVSYSINKIPYGFNIDPDKWTIRNIYTGDYTTTSTSYAQAGGTQITLPVGSWRTRMKTNLRFTLSGNNEGQGFVALSTSTSATSDDSLAHTIHTPAIASLGGSVYDNVFLDRVIAVSSATTYYQIFKRTVALSFLVVNADTNGVLEIEFAYL